MGDLIIFSEEKRNKNRKMSKFTKEEEKYINKLIQLFRLKNYKKKDTGVSLSVEAIKGHLETLFAYHFLQK